MPVADVVDGKIVVHTAYHERHLVQQVPGARYDRAAGHWTTPLAWSTCVVLRGLFRDDLLAGNGLRSWSWSVYNDRIEPALYLRDAMELSADDPVAHCIDLVEERGEAA